MMMAPPQVVGVLLKKPGQHNHPRVPPLDPQETKIRGELYVEDLNERRIVSIRMGWLWVEGTQMRLPLRALNLRQATPGICQPHVLALGFTLSNSQGDLLATFWADTEPIYWSWVRAIAAELVRQTPFRAQRCLNFLEILTICPRGPVPLPESPTETRRRSRSEFRCWLGDSRLGNENPRNSSIIEDSRRRARSELRGWSSSNSSDEDLVIGDFRSLQTTILPKVVTGMINGRSWGCSESSEGSDDSLPWGGGCRSSVDSIDSAPTIPEPDTREQRIQRYKEARRRENEARSRRVLEEDAKRRKARKEENNNNDDDDVAVINRSNDTNKVNATKRTNGTTSEAVGIEAKSPESDRKKEMPIKTCEDLKIESKAASTISKITDPFVRAAETVDSITRRLPPLNVSSKSPSPIVRFVETNVSHREDDRNNNNNNNNNNISINNHKNSSKISNSVSSDCNATRYKLDSPPSPGVARTDSGERRSRARERRNVREKAQVAVSQRVTNNAIKTLEERKERLTNVSSRIPVSSQVFLRTSSNSRLTEMRMESLSRSECRERGAVSLPRSTGALSILSIDADDSPNTILSSPCEEDVARLLERCQRVDHYVPVREKLTLFESLSRLGGRLARSTEDLGRSSSKPSPRGKQRARSLHDLNRGARTVPVREMCRLFEGERDNDHNNSLNSTATIISMSTGGFTRFSERDSSLGSPARIFSTKDPPQSILKNNNQHHHHHHRNTDVPPCVRTSTRRKHYQK